MILKLLVSGLVVLGGFFAVTTPAPQDAEEMAKMMAMYEKAATPGAEHKALESLVGKWDQQNKFMMGGPPMESKGTAEYKSILGGRFVVCDTKSKMTMPGPDGKPVERDFTGFMVLGYDNALKQYQSLWCDSFGTGMFMSTGTADAAGKLVTLEGTMKDVLTPQGRPWKMTILTEGPDKQVTELWDAMDGKTLQKVGIITSTRAK
jgi:hypothetical protein